MLRIQIAAGFALALAIAVAGALFAYWVAHRGYGQVERAESSDKVLTGFVAVGALAEQVLLAIADSAITNQVDLKVAEELRTRIDVTVAELRRDIGAEVTLTGGAEQQSEVEELIALLGLEEKLGEAIALLFQVDARAVPARTAWRRASALLDSADPGGFRHRINALIDQERRQAAATDAQTERLMRELRRAALALAVTAIVTLVTLAIYFTRRLRTPFNELVAATQAMQTGDIERRARIDTHDEFGLIAASLNAMAEDRERKRQALAQAQERLERTVAQRTEELRLANESLQRADAQRRQLFADISHELRTPITVIRGEAEITLRGGVKPIAHYQVALERVTQIAAQLARLVDDLLLISRSDAGVHGMRMGAVSLRGLLESACIQARALHAGKGVDIQQRPMPGEVVLHGDQDRLLQLFVILLDNAVRYSDAPEPVVMDVSIAADRVTVHITDQGVGIPAHELDGVFQRFYRGDRANTRDGNGVGLGLPIAKAIVDAHGGKIDLQSAPGVGTTVSVSLAISRLQRAVA